MNNITTFQKCKCGAVTLTFENGASSSMSYSTYRKLRLGLRSVERFPMSWCCDHCVNHYGIDLCSCGSGKRVGRCDCGSKEPMQQLGKELDHIGMIMKGFGL